MLFKNLSWCVCVCVYIYIYIYIYIFIHCILQAFSDCPLIHNTSTLELFHFFYPIMVVSA